eukprot:CAMPEP_0177737250 /NCGR_PEP_ID=MMETSP0484_2-20121128/25784_1 /TAXON_ID=354590 /ORGANISM="Rhodomonas lens, Strain RHODO" /LENGTH=93 /DNA_ID=CAMNT_0019251017 /DNA_START=378 /DNA_END=659 /DNA_ORIENTATION=-
MTCPRAGGGLDGETFVHTLEACWTLTREIRRWRDASVSDALPSVGRDLGVARIETLQTCRAMAPVRINDLDEAGTDRDERAMRTPGLWRAHQQ